MIKIALITFLHCWVYIFIKYLSFRRLIQAMYYLQLFSNSQYEYERVNQSAKYLYGILCQSKLKHPSCYEISIMMMIILACKRIRVKLCLGVAKEDGQIVAHAWLIYRGLIIPGDHSTHGFVSIFQIDK